MTASSENGRRRGGGQSSPPGLEQVAEIWAGEVPPEMIGIDLPRSTANLLASARPTPAARDFKGVDRTEIDRGNARPLNEVATTWATPRVEMVRALGNPKHITKSRGKGFIEDQVAGWSTPSAHDGRRPGPDLHSTQGRNLSREAAQWSTPSVADVTGGRTSRSGDRKGELLLNSMAAYVSQNAWPTPTALSRPRSEETPEKCGAYRKALAGQNTVPLYLEEVALASTLPAPETETPGQSSPNADPTSSRPSLNPRFVEWLMNWPPGWTNFDCSETAFILWKERTRSALSQLTSHAAPPAQLSLFG